MKALPLVLGVLAIATAIPAWIPRSSAVVVESSRSGQLLNRGNKTVSAEQVAGLRVVTWDDSASMPKVFEVNQSQGTWVIPSHFNYPADGGSRVGKTSGGVRDVTFGRLVTSDSKQHESLGVVDPMSADSKLKGRGKRVVLKDKTGGVLVDLIIGKSVPESDGLSFVRDADQVEVYTAKVDGDISTKFIDWVETDLMKLKAEDIRGIAVADYSVNEQTSAIEERSLTRFARTSATADWVSAQTPAEKRVFKETVDKILSQVTSLRLSGVRKFDLQVLLGSGFFPSDNPQVLSRPDALKVAIGGKTYALFGNEGSVDFTTKDGLRYSLLFGEITTEDEEKPSSEPKKANKDAKPPATGHNRYMSVYVQYDPSADEDAQKAKIEAEAKKAEAEKLAAAAAADPAKAGEKPADKPADKPAEAPAVPPGKQRAAKAQARFSQFFYVISDDNFKSLRPALAQLFEAKPVEKPAEGAAPPAAPAPAPLAPAPPAPPAPTAPAPAPAAPAPAPASAAPSAPAP
jgi:Domain of unknown function (DUF4340)